MPQSLGDTDTKFSHDKGTELLHYKKDDLCQGEVDLVDGPLAHFVDKDYSLVNVINVKSLE